MSTMDGGNKFFSDILSTVDFIANDVKQNNLQAQRQEMLNSMFERQKKGQNIQRKMGIMESVYKDKQFKEGTREKAFDNLIQMYTDPDTDISGFDPQFADPADKGTKPTTRKLLPRTAEYYGFTKEQEFPIKIAEMYEKERLYRTRPPKPKPTPKPGDEEVFIYNEKGDKVGKQQELLDRLEDASDLSTKMLSETKKRYNERTREVEEIPGNEGFVAKHLNIIKKLESKITAGKPLTDEEIEWLTDKTIFNPDDYSFQESLDDLKSGVKAQGF